MVHTTSYKTVAKGKRISDTLIPEVGHLLDQYLDGGHRKLLLGKTGDRHIFVGENGSIITTETVTRRVVSKRWNHECHLSMPLAWLFRSGLLRDLMSTRTAGGSKSLFQPK